MLSYSDFRERFHQRSDLRESIEKYWVGRQRSNIGVQYLRLDNGVVRLSGMYERRDLILLQLPKIMNVFITPFHGKCEVQIDLWPETRSLFQLTAEGREQINQFAAEAVYANQEYWDREVRFLTEKPWEQCDGLTPEATVAKLKELGW